MPKVLRIINRLNLGGPTYNASYLSRYIDPRFETVLLSGMKDDTEASSEFIAQSMGLEPVYVSDMHRSINPFRDRKAFAEIKRVIREFKPDIVHTHAAKAGALGRLAAHQLNVPVIVHTFHGHVFHSYFHPLKTRVFLEIERYLAKRSSAIIAISDLQKQELCDTFNVCEKDKVEVIPLGFDLSRFQADKEVKRAAFRQQYNIQDDEIAIGIVGRLVPIKNHRLFLAGVKAVSEKTNKKIRAFIIGDGESRHEVEQHARDMSLPFAIDGFKDSSALVTFTSWIKEVDVAYAGLDIVALTSFNEGTPVSLIEAQAANKPVVSTAVGGIKDVVKENESALLCPTDDDEKFSEQLLRLVEEDDLRNNMGLNAFEFINAKYNYTRLVNDMTQLYDSLLAKAGR